MHELGSLKVNGARLTLINSYALPDKRVSMVLTIRQIEAVARTLRRDVLSMTTAAGSGHPTSCLSAAEIMAVLWFREMSYDSSHASNQSNDEFILSKGHAAPLYYACLQRAGCMNESLEGLRTHGSSLEGHPMPSTTPWIKAATGSLGQGLAIGAGCALAARMKKTSSRTYVLMGDSECSEGSVSEAAAFASYHKLSSLCAIIDLNRLGQRGETMLGYDALSYKKRFESVGWQAIIVPGHNVAALLSAFKRARTSKKPYVIIAKTVKGKGLSFAENKEGWHGRTLTTEELAQALRELKEMPFPAIESKLPRTNVHSSHALVCAPPLSYEKGQAHATREGYGKGLARFAADNEQVIALDAEVSNSTYADKVQQRTPHQFIECFIAEQTLIGVTQGLAIKGYIPYASTFAAFVTRAHDQLRMAAISNASFTLCGSHAGVATGHDGASQMGLEDIALARSLPHTTVFSPSDAVSAERLIHLAAHTPGLKYIRTTRPPVPIIYNAKEEFIVNEFKVLHLSPNDSVVLIGTGITVHEVLKAHAHLKKQGISTAVIDAYCIHPFPISKCLEFVKKHGSRVIVVEDHYYAGGLGEMLASAFVNTSCTFKHLAVPRVPHSGTSEQLLEDAQINSKSICAAVHALLK